MSPAAAEREPWRRLFDLFHEGRPLESILSGWQLTPEKVAQLVLAGHRSGEKVDPAWLVPASVRDRVLGMIRERPDLSATAISSTVQGRVSPAIVAALRSVLGGGTIETRLFNEDTFLATLTADLLAAKSEILVVAPEIRGRHWRTHHEAFARVQRGGGQVAFFTGSVAETALEPLRDAAIVLIEKRSNANLVLVDGAILWEGSMNFLMPPRGEEHVRRTVSRLQCDEVRDLADLWI